MLWSLALAVVPEWISSITCTDFVFTVSPVPTPWVFSWLVMMVITPDLENQTTWRKNSHPAPFKPSCILLSSPFPSTSNWTRTGDCWANRGKKKYPFCVKSLAAELLDWLTVGLIGARAKGKCGNVAKGGGMWFGSPFLQFNFAYIEELYQGTILSCSTAHCNGKFFGWILKPSGHKHCK